MPGDVTNPLWGGSPKKDYRKRFLSRLPRQSTCPEIGVHKGDFAGVILAITAPSKLHLIDPWKFETDPTYEHSLYGGSAGRSQSSMDAIYESVLQPFRVRITSGTVEIHRNASAECAGVFPDGYFDWIYINGNHQYEFVKTGSGNVLSENKEWGLVAGHDYGRRGWWEDGVARAVDEAAQAGALQKLLIEDHQFLLRKI